MATCTKDLRQRRAKMIVDAQKMTEVGEKENRNLTSEEQETYDKLFTGAEEMEKRYRRIEEIDKQERALDDPIEEVRPDDLHTETPERRTQRAGGEPETTVKNSATDEYRSGYEKFLRYGEKAFAGQLTPLEQRALQADNDTQAGYLVVPEKMASGIIQAVDNMVFVRRRGTIHTVTDAASLGAVSLDTDIEDGTWTAEIGSVDEDTALAFGKRALTPHLLTKLIKLSQKLVRSSAIPISSLVQERMGYKFGVTHEKNFLTGTGAHQPLGVFTASDDGIGTGRDVSTGNTTTSMTFDGLKEAKYTLKSQYWNRSAWAFHRDGVKQLAKLKDGEGQYIWEQSVKVGEPDRVLGLPMEVSEYVPNTFTTGLYVGILGDWSFYWIVDALGFTIQVLDELYARTSQIGYIGRQESDGMPVLAEAFVRVKLG